MWGTGLPISFCQVLHWCATWEECTTGKKHTHLQLQFRTEVDVTTAAFTLCGVRPNVEPNDLCGEGVNRKKYPEHTN